MKKTYPLSLLAATLFSSAATTLAIPVELITNGSFETGDFTAWTTNVTGTPFRPWSVSGAGRGGGFGIETTSPQDGTFVAWNGFDGRGPLVFTLDQQVTIPPLHSATLSWKHKAQWDFTLGSFAALPRVFEVSVLDPADNSVLATLFSFSTGTQAQNPTGNTGWVAQSADLSAYAGSSVIVRFEASIPQSGTGPGQLELDQISLLSELVDSDGDGIPDDVDACVLSDLSPTVVIDGCDTGVVNLLFDNGCTIADLIHHAAADVRNHGQFVSAVAKLTNELVRGGFITGSDKGSLVSCAANSSVGHY